MRTARRWTRFFRPRPDLPPRAELLSLAEETGSAVAVLDPEGRTLELGAGAASLLGWDHETSVGEVLAQRLHHADRDRVVGAITAVATGERDRLVGLHARVRRADGSWLELEMGVSNRLGDPSVRGLMLTLRDVTAQLELDAVERIGPVGIADDQPTLCTGAGQVEVKAPRVADNRAEQEREPVSSGIPPRYVRKWPKVTEVLPVPYLRKDDRPGTSHRCSRGLRL